MGKILVCSKCGHKHCSGKIFEVPTQSYGNLYVCENDITYKDGKAFYRYVMGHGCEWDIEAKLVEE